MYWEREMEKENVAIAPGEYGKSVQQHNILDFNLW